MKELKRLRLAAKLSQEELAKKAGLSRVAISLLENGKSTDAMSSTVVKLAGALNVDPQVLLRSEAYVNIQQGGKCNE